MTDAPATIGGEGLVAPPIERLTTPANDVRTLAVLALFAAALGGVLAAMSLLFGCDPAALAVLNLL